MDGMAREGEAGQGVRVGEGRERQRGRVEAATTARSVRKLVCFPMLKSEQRGEAGELGRVSTSRAEKRRGGLALELLAMR